MANPMTTGLMSPLGAMKQGLLGIGQAAKQTYNNALLNPAVDEYRMGVGKRMADALRDPVGFMGSAARDVTPTPRGLLEAVGGADTPESQEAKERMQGIALAAMLTIPGRGKIPETHDDVKKLSDRFETLLTDAGVDYARDKSALSPARYFSFTNPSSPHGEAFKVRISDHKNVHGADFSVDPHTGATFEEMLSTVRELGVPIASRAKPKQRLFPLDERAIEKMAGKPIKDISEMQRNFFIKNYKMTKDGDIF